MQNTGLSLAFDFAVNITVLSITGHLIDEKLSIGPWGLVIGLILGTAVSFYQLYKFLNKE